MRLVRPLLRRRVMRFRQWILSRPANPRRVLTSAVVATLGILCMAPTWWVGEENLSLNYWHSCYPSEVMSYSNRVHVRCAQPATGGLYYFAVPTSDINAANRFATIASGAMAGGQRFRVQYNTTDNGSSWGCGYSDCRPPRACGIVP